MLHKSAGLFVCVCVYVMKERKTITEGRKGWEVKRERLERKEGMWRRTGNTEREGSRGEQEREEIKTLGDRMTNEREEAQKGKEGQRE